MALSTASAVAVLDTEANLSNSHSQSTAPCIVSWVTGTHSGWYICISSADLQHPINKHLFLNFSLKNQKTNLNIFSPWISDNVLNMLRHLYHGLLIYTKSNLKFEAFFFVEMHKSLAFLKSTVNLSNKNYCNSFSCLIKTNFFLTLSNWILKFGSVAHRWWFLRLFCIGQTAVETYCGCLEQWWWPSPPQLQTDVCSQWSAIPVSCWTGG